MDEPLADPSAAALYFVANTASKHVKVALSGEEQMKYLADIIYIMNHILLAGIIKYHILLEKPSD